MATVRTTLEINATRSIVVDDQRIQIADSAPSR
jgi:hypothetical protein